jgi:glycosyltransferase involved in cell wall biosynthesis
MRIAQIAPLHEAVPPKLYGGTERVVSYLTEELVALGHQVTLFASGDSVTSACLHAVWPRSLRLDPAMRDVIAPHMLMMEEVRRRAEDFDVLHFHLDYWPFSIFTRQKVPFVTTLHGRLDLPELKPIFNAFRDVPVVSISDAQVVAELPGLGISALSAAAFLVRRACNARPAYSRHRMRRPRGRTRETP